MGLSGEREGTMVKCSSCSLLTSTITGKVTGIRKVDDVRQILKNKHVVVTYNKGQVDSVISV